MKVEINYVPPQKIITTPDPEATYPFEINGEFQYIVDFSCYSESDYSYSHEEFFCNWMESSDGYPIYSLMEIYNFQLTEYVELFKMHNIEFNYRKGSRNDNFFVKVIIRNQQQFKEYYPYLHGNGGMMNLSLWSLKQDLFSLEEIATLTKSSTMFWVGYDGDFITAFSNDEHFSTIDSLQKIMPEKVELVVIDYDWE